MTDDLKKTEETSLEETQETVELSDDELENVAGGGPYFVVY